MLGPRQPAHYRKLTFRQLLCWGPSPTCIVCRNWCSNFSMLGPRTRIEKCLLQVHFISVNY
ncbi:hypothetical protein C0103_10940 [Staphylococcus aureus]|nr:hypothetical protein BRL61_10410 [Staphylococcus aureus]EFB43483.1 conserved hypothetical protein [Staphylococcus aureus subsp. aureus C101]EFB51726.1 hypothetical protein SAWG_02367 [Staphylococcus aureus subsp. aureus M899]EFD96924.1 hypothetical protein SAVG_02416 [Staphylococcus aureus subsp. aureus M1015]EFE25094.1 conserved hypothetical protein [Staphylococcus aureus subsp. aureus 58-424]